ncbi:MAG: hypothetical protein IJT68_05155 [Lentisphaeria bacterium]|nr:hypothetical protein [Lentisphaeria bacterium]
MAFFIDLHIIFFLDKYGNRCYIAGKIRADSRFTSLPVYSVTADIEEQKAFAEHGFTGILLKPVTIVKLSRLFN